MKIKLADSLLLGDVVSMDLKSQFSHMVVVKKDKDGVEMVRPFIHLGDFKYVDGVLNYIGQEIMKVNFTSKLKFYYFSNIYYGIDK